MWVCAKNTPHGCTLSTHSPLSSRTAHNMASLVEEQKELKKVGRTTTLSTIAMSSNPPTPTSPPTRLVVALLQTPHQGLHLKVLELSPPLLHLPDTLPQAQLALSDHDAVIRNLQSKQSPVEELLRQADSLIATQKPRAEVYAAMADSLGSAWSQLSSVLEARRSVLALALAAHQEIDSVSRRIDSTHQRCSRLVQAEEEEEELPPVEWLKAERSGILKGVASALEACDALLGQIGSFSYSIDSRDLVLLQDTNTANRQVQRWLERLHDRRVLLEERLRVKREEVEERFRAYRVESELTSLEVEVEAVALGLESTTLGESLQAVLEREEPSLLAHSAALKVIQEKALGTTRSLEEGAAPKWTVGGSELKKRAFDLLSRTADLLAESNDLELSLTNAATFFRLVEEEGEEEEAIHLGDDLIHTHPPHRTQGIRALHATLTAKKEEELRNLDSHNAFLTSLNETFELLLRLEETPPAHLPVATEELISLIATLKEELTHRSVEIEGRLRSLEEGLRRDDKLRAEEELTTRTEELQTLLQRWRRTLEGRLSVATGWEGFLSKLTSGGGRVEGWLETVARAKAALQAQNALEVGEALDYLDTLEQRLLAAREIVSTTTRSLLEEELEGVWPILGGGESLLLLPTPPALTHIVDHVLPLKSDTVRAEVFGALRSSVRSQVDAALGLTRRERLLHEEEEFNVLVTEKENRFVEVVEEIRRFLRALGDVCVSLGEEERKARTRSAGSAQEELSALERLQGRVEEAWGMRLHPQLETLVRLIFRVESVGAARREEEALRSLSEVMRREWVEERLGAAREGLEGRLRAELVAADLAVIGEQLEDLIAELEKPPSYGDSLRDAQVVVTNFERFERTVEMLETKLKEMLRKAGDVGEEEERLKGKLRKLQSLRGGRKEALLLSLDYFSLIQEWEEEWERLESTLSSIRTESKTTNIGGERIESLLNQVRSLRSDEARQEDRLSRINAMAARLFPQEIEQRTSRPQNKNTQLSARLQQVEDELRAILRALQEESEALRREARRKEEEAMLREARRKEEEARRKEEEIRRKEEENEEILREARRKEEEARQKEEEDRRKEENEALLREARRKEEEARRQEQETRRKEEETRRKEEETRRKEEEARRKEENEALLREARRKEEEARRQEQETRRKEENEALLREVRRKEEMSVFVTSSSTSTATTSHVRFQDETREDRVSGEWEELRRSTATPTRLEKETQSEGGEERGASPLPPRKAEREVVTQTPLPGEIGVPVETQTEEELPPSPGPPPAAIVEPLLDVTVEEGGRAVLTCRTSGDVGPLVWLKDGMDVSPNSDFKTSFNETTGVASLTIDEVVPEDAAVFTCRALGGSLETSGRLTVKEAEGTSGEVFSPPSWISGPAFVEATEGEGPVVVEGVVDGYPLPTVTWEKDGQCIDLSHDYVLTFNNGRAMLLIEDPLASLDSGDFTAIAMNRLGEARLTFSLRVRKPERRKGDAQPPLILRPLPKRLLLHTGQRADRLVLRFEYAGTPDPSVCWILNDSHKIEPNTAGSKIESGGGVASLTYESVVPSMSGKYSATIRNPYGSATTECQVTIKGVRPLETSDSEMGQSDLEAVKPTVKMGLEDVTEAEVGKPARLDCVIVGVPEPEVIWFHDGIPVKESPTHHLTFTGDRCSLLLTSVSPQDIGTYLVQAINAVGEASSSGRLALKEIPHPVETEAEPPKFTKLLEDAMVPAGDPHEFSVEVGDPRDHVEVTWYRNNEKLTPAAPNLTMEEKEGRFSVRWSSVSPADKGNYMAKAERRGKETKTFACLIVKDTPGEKVATPPVVTLRRPSFPKATQRPPRFVVDLQGQMVNEGDVDVTLKGLLEAGGGDTEVLWKKGPLVLAQGPKYLLQCAKGNGDVGLTIRGAVGVTDAGVYSVVASNSAGTGSSSAQLLVKKTTFPPVFNKRLEGIVSVEEGKRLFLEVDVFAVPPPTVTWTMSGGKEPREGVVVSSDTPTRFSFAIPQVEGARDAGEVTVTARNSSGEAKSSCVIQVAPGRAEEKTEKTEESVTTTRLEERTLTEERTVVQEVIAVTRVTSVSPSPAKTFVTSVSPSLAVERGPSPEILIAPSPTPTWTKSSENAVLKKVKTFEERVVVETPPAGGVKTLPTPPHPPPTLAPAPKEKPTPPPKPSKIPPPPPPSTLPPQREFILPPPVLEFVPPPSSAEFAVPPPLVEFIPPPLREKPLPPPKPRSPQERPKSETFFYPLGAVPQEPRPRSELLSSPTFRPSKFIPEKMRESSYSTDTSPILPLWTPPTQPPPPPPPVTTTSAFARTVPTSLPPPPPPPVVVAPQVPPKPAVPPPTPAGVKAIASTWPPLPTEAEVAPRNLAAPPSHQPRLLSPISVQVAPPQRSRSPTPNLEALEMERSWSRPIRFASPRPSSPLRSPQAAPQIKSPVPPQIKTPVPPQIKTPVPPQIKTPVPPPQVKTPTPPAKPIPPPKPMPKSPSPSIYYVSVTSPPRTTPIPPMSPPPLSPLPQTSFTSFESSSYFESSFTSTTTTTSTDPSGLVPGETPQFLYAAPPPPPPQEAPPQVSTSMALVPYIKPSKFHPHLSDSTWRSETMELRDETNKILPLWDPRGVRVTTWKRVEPPSLPQQTFGGMDDLREREERLLNLKKNFQETIEGLEPGFLYNELWRKIESSLDEGKPAVEGEPLLYFKYDFGYEFGLADPRAVIVSNGNGGEKSGKGSSRALPPPPQNEDEEVIHLPVIHETKKKTK